MTREEAISIMKVIVHMLEEKYDTDRVEEAVDMAIEALEQEPKSEWQQDHEILKAHSDGANEVLAIIRAEIAKEAKCTMNDNRAGGLYKALQIIDKYAEEDKA